MTSSTPSSAAGTKPQVGCHLIVFRGKQDEDLDAVLKDVQAAGFDGVEARILAGGDPKAARAKLDEFGLRQGSMSTSYAMLDELDKSIEYATGVGARFIMVSGVGDHQTEGLRAYEKSADRFNEAGRKCKAAGIQFCYHNHSWEFQTYSRASGEAVDHGTPGSVNGLERLLELTDKDLVKGCFDVYWIQHGGENPASFLERYRDRVGYPHFKDMKYLGEEPRRKGRLNREEATFVELGRGEVDLKAVWDVLKPLHLPWVVYEQDRSELPPGEAAKISRDHLKTTVGI
ncbi:MAG TPA: sugar phosphate isomerase/epimerase [Chloroflexota bacterium]|nr:sugar phosphate isomerase/epimerase [Chloroflexota bacterium]